MTARRDPEPMADEGDAELQRALRALSRERPHPDDLKRIRQRLEHVFEQPAPARVRLPKTLSLPAMLALAGVAVLGAWLAMPRLGHDTSQPTTAETPAAAPAADGVAPPAQPQRVPGPDSAPVADAARQGAAPALHGPEPRQARLRAGRNARHGPGRTPTASSAPQGDAPPPGAGAVVTPSALPEQAATQPAPAAGDAVQAPTRSATALPDEVSLLSRARQRASADPASALRLLGEHERSFPHGALSPEREVLAIQLLRALSRDAEAEQRVRAFRKAYPGSVYLSRIQR